MQQTSNNSQPSLVKADRLLRSGKVLNAIDMTSAALKAQNISGYDNYLQQLRQSYAYMLRYALTGNDDPGREMLKADTIADLQGIISEVLMDERTKSSPSTIPSVRRLSRVRNLLFESMIEKYHDLQTKKTLLDETEKDSGSLQRERENLIRDIFDHTLSLGFNNRKELKQIEKLCADSEESFELRAILVSSLYLSFSMIFNRYKFITLLNILNETADDRLRARVMTSIFLILIQWHDEVATDRRLSLMLEDWKDSILNYTLLREVVKSYLRSLDTSRINDRIKKDIIPGLQSIQPDLLKSLKKNKDNEDYDYEGNPEWEEILRKSGMDKKMQEFQELQSEGSDLMMLPLSQLKNVAFFNVLSNWFLPFTPDNSELTTLKALKNTGMDIIFSDMTGMCHTDRYSLALALNMMPEQQRIMLFSHLKTQSEQLQTIINDRMLKESSPQFKLELERYMRDLYRFYSLYRNRRDFFNPFAGGSEFLKIPILHSWLEEPEMMDFLSEFFFKRGYYSEAEKIFTMIVTTQDKVDGYVWQKLGYVYQKLGKYSEALDSYSKAELFQASDSWMVKSQAYCHEQLGHYSIAASLYRHAHLESPENKKLLDKYVSCSFLSGNEEEALKELYRYDYEHRDSVDKQIIIGELLTGKFDSAGMRIDKYMLMLEQTPENLADYHIFKMIGEIQSNNLQDALNHMDKATDMLNQISQGGANSERYKNLEDRLFSYGLLSRYHTTLLLLQEVSYDLHSDRQ